MRCTRARGYAGDGRGSIAHIYVTTKRRHGGPYDLRHAFASLLIAAGKNPLYIARQMGHYSAGFCLDTYGHLMEPLSKRQVEWIDELVFPEGYEAALKLHLSGALSSATACDPVQPMDEREGLEIGASSNVVQSGTTGCMAEGGRFELPRGFPLAVFKTAAIARSAIPPRPVYHMMFRWLRASAPMPS